MAADPSSCRSAMMCLTPLQHCGETSPLSAEHKAASGCTGKRDRTQYVGLPAFTERQLVSDYQLLEETQRAKVRCDAKLSGSTAAQAHTHSCSGRHHTPACRGQQRFVQPDAAICAGSCQHY